MQFKFNDGDITMNNQLFFVDRELKRHYLEKSFSKMKDEIEWIEVGIDSNGKNYKIDLDTGKINLNGEWIEVGKEINGYYEKFSGKNLDYGKNLIYYCESTPMGVGGKNLIIGKIYLGYECDLDRSINYSLYTVEKYSVMLVCDCKDGSVGISIDTTVNFHINGKNVLIKI